MDYSYYTATGQPYQFNSFPPTSSQSYEGGNDAIVDAQDVYQGVNGFPNYDPSFQFANNAFLQPGLESGPASSLSVHTQTPPNANQARSAISLERANSGLLGEFQGETSNNEAPNGSDSDDKDSATPQQSRRKAQNRAAQRAFRERKEKHVKELETKLNDLSEHSSNLVSDNERLKKELQRLATQNEILRATAAQPQAPPRPPSPLHGPQTYSPTDFATAVGLAPSLHPITYDSFDGGGGEKLLAAGATWDLIQRHELIRRGRVNIADVCLRLKGKASCDGRGYAFKEDEVIQAIEESAHSDNDELI